MIIILRTAKCYDNFQTAVRSWLTDYCKLTLQKTCFKILLKFYKKINTHISTIDPRRCYVPAVSRYSLDSSNDYDTSQLLQSL